MAWPAEAHYSTVSPPLRSAARGMAFVGASLVETLQVRASVQRDDCAYTFLNDGERPGESVTYGELECRSRIIAALQAEGMTAEEFWGC